MKSVLFAIAMMLGIISVVSVNSVQAEGGKILTVDAACAVEAPVEDEEAEEGEEPEDSEGTDGTDEPIVDECVDVDTFKTLEEAVAKSGSGDTIVLNNHATLSAQINLKEGTVLNGNGYTVFASFAKTDNSNNSAIGVQKSDVTIKNITIDGSNGSDLHGVNVYKSTGVSLIDVTAKNFRSGVVVNGSEVTAENLVTNGNAWNSVNIDPGSGVNQDSEFILKSGQLNDATQIWSDGRNVTETATVTVTIEDTESIYTEYAVIGSKKRLWSTTVPSALGAAQIGNVYYDTLALAIENAIDGETITLNEGTHTTTGQVVIDKNLSIVGANKSTTMIKSTTDTITGNTDSAAWFFVQEGVEFNLSNVTLDGNSEVRKINWAIASYGNGTIDNVAFKNIKSGKYAGRGIVVFGDMTITNSTFTNIERIGIHVRGAYSGSAVGKATISGNTFVCKGEGDFLDYAVEVGAGASATISDNTISDCRGVAETDGSTSAGILVTDYYGTGTKATITGNTITNSTHAIAAGYNETDASIVTAHENTFSGNEFAITSTHPAVDATNNWWGSVLGPTHASNPGGAGDKVTDNVTFTPWYMNVGMTLLSTAISGDTLTSGEVDVEIGQGNTGEAALPTGVTTVTLSSSAGLDVSGGIDNDEVTIKSGSVGEPVVLINSELAGFSVSIPDGTTIEGSNGWDGIIIPPRPQSASGRAPSGFSVGGTVIEVGSPDATLEFDSPVVLVLPGVTDAVGYKPSGSNTWVRITDVCTDYASPTGAPAGGECAISNGTDTKILTYHFTSFGNLAVKSSSSGSKSRSRSNTTVSALTTPTAAPTVSASVSTVAYARDLGVGARGEDVTVLQNRLIAEGVYEGPATGYFGPLTEEAVKRYQTKAGIPSTGFVGPLTREKLNGAVAVTMAPAADTTALKATLEAKLKELLELLKAALEAQTKA